MKFLEIMNPIKAVRQAKEAVKGAIDAECTAAVDKAYSKLFIEISKIHRREIDNQAYVYWKHTVLESYFGSSVSGEINPEGAEIKKWLVGFVEHIRIKQLTDSDNEFLCNKFLPFMEGQRDVSVQIAKEKIKLPF